MNASALLHCGHGRTLQEPQQLVAAGAHAQLRSQPCPGLASPRQNDGAACRGQPTRAALVWPGQLLYRLGDSEAWPDPVAALEAAYLHADRHGVTQARTFRQQTPVLAME